MNHRITKQDTGKYRQNLKDQFYTKNETAIECIQGILSNFPETRDYLWIEPSAGNGVFLNNLPPLIEAVGIDIDPGAETIIKSDFLSWTPPSTERKIIVYGNPPFGRQSSMAKAFIAKSCGFSSIIAFILPKSFTKPSMYGVFDKKFHCKISIELGKNSFLLNGVEYDVPCVFQIWQKCEYDRDSIDKIHPVGFNYVKPGENYDFAIRRVGALAGKCYINNGTMYSHQSHYFIKLLNGHLNEILEKINGHVFPSNTVGPRSLSKNEINSVLNMAISSSVLA